MRLDDWMRENKLNQASLGARLNPPVSQGAISQIMRGDVRMRLDYALQIEEITCGAVTPKDCAELFRPKESAEQAAA